MSGGSYNYLCSTYDPEDLFNKSRNLVDMSARLAELGYAEDAAGETEELVCMLNQMRVQICTRMKRLRGVWHAVEWWDSGDSGEDGLKQALKEYRGAQ